MMITEIDRVLESNEARANATAVSASASVGAAMELPYWPALTVLARAREVRRHRLIRSVSAVAAALLPVAGFGLLHLRGPGEVGGASAALALGGVVQPRVVQSGTDRVGPSQATPQLSPGGVTVVGEGIGIERGRVLLAGDQASRSATSVVASARDRRPRPRLAPVPASSQSFEDPTPPSLDVTRPDQPRSEPAGPAQPNIPKPDVPKPDVPKPDVPKPDAPKPDVPKPDAPKPDAPKPDAPKPDAPKPDAPKPDRPKPDTPKPDRPKPDTPKPDNPSRTHPSRTHPSPTHPSRTHPSRTSQSRTSKSRTRKSRTRKSRTRKSRRTRSPTSRSRTSPRSRTQTILIRRNPDSIVDHCRCWILLVPTTLP